MTQDPKTSSESLPMTHARVLDLARRADHPELAQRRRAGAWRVWSDGEVTADGRPPLCEALGGADDLALRFPHKAGQGTYAWVTRRDALVIRDAIAELLGAPQVVRRRSLWSAGVARPEDKLPWPVLTDPPDVLASAHRLTSFVHSSSAATALTRATERLLVAREFGAALACPDRDLLELYAGACGATYGDPALGEAIDQLLSVVDREGAWLDRVSTTLESVSAYEVRVDLQAIVAACGEAIAGRPADSSPPRVTISADVLRAVASYARALRETALGGSIADLATLAANGPTVSGSGANDADGSVVERVEPRVQEAEAARTETSRSGPLDVARAVADLNSRARVTTEDGGGPPGRLSGAFLKPLASWALYLRTCGSLPALACALEAGLRAYDEAEVLEDEHRWTLLGWLLEPGAHRDWGYVAALRALLETLAERASVRSATLSRRPDLTALTAWSRSLRKMLQRDLLADAAHLTVWALVYALDAALAAFVAGSVCFADDLQILRDWLAKDTTGVYRDDVRALLQAISPSDRERSP